MRNEMKMGTHFKKSIFDEHVQAGLLGWAQKAKKGLKTSANPNRGATTQLGKVVRSEKAKDEIELTISTTSAAAEVGK